MKLLFALLFALCLGITNALAAVNVNTATQAELETLNGIGPAKAKAIIDYRNKNGAFKTVEELDKVPGIGEGTLKKIRADVTLTGATTVKAQEKGATQSAKSEKASRSASETKNDKKAASDEKKSMETKKEDSKQTPKKADEKSAAVKESAGSSQKDAKKSGSAADEKKSSSAK